MTFRVLTQFALVFAVAWQTPGFADGCDRTLRYDLLDKVNGKYSRTLKTRIYHEQILNEAEQLQIRSILATPNARHTDFERAFEIYLEARLRGCSDRQKRLITNNTAKIIFSDKGEISANGGWITFPSPYRDSILPYIIRAHETEHLIQLLPLIELVLANKKSRGAILREWVSVLNGTFGPGRYWAEYEAMLAEWELYNLAPPELLSRELESLNKIKSSNHYETFFRDTIGLVKKTHSRDQYIAVQHGAGRYSVSQIALSSISNGVVVSAAAFAAYFAGDFAFGTTASLFNSLMQ